MDIDRMRALVVEYDEAYARLAAVEDKIEALSAKMDGRAAKKKKKGPTAVALLAAKGTGTKKKRAKRGKLTEAKVKEIRKRLKAKESDASIAKWAKVSVGSVGHIRTGHTWSHVK